MELGAGIENETLQNLIRDCLLELNRLKFDLTELEIAKARDTTPQKIQELENHILNKEKEVSLIKFKAEDEISLLKKQLEEKDALIKNQEDRIYELDYVNNSLDEIKEYFAEQLRDYKKKELAEVNERLNESFKSIAEKDAQINTLSRTIDDYKIYLQKYPAGKYKDEARKNVADDLNVGIDDVNIKATTTEKLGFEGRGEGISATAVVLLK